MIMTRETMVKMLKAAAAEVMTRAEDLVGNANMMTDMNVWIKLRPNEIPEIMVDRTYTSEEATQVLIDEQTK